MAGVFCYNGGRFLVRDTRFHPQISSRDPAIVDILRRLKPQKIGDKREYKCRREVCRARSDAVDGEKLALLKQYSVKNIGFQKPDSELRSHLHRMYNRSGRNRAPLSDASSSSQTSRSEPSDSLYSEPSSISSIGVSSHPRQSAEGVPVYVMLPLDSVWLIDQDGKDPQQVLLRERAIEVGLEMLKAAGVEGVMVDVWWGLVEYNEREYDFSAYSYLFEMLASKGLKVQAVMSFHAAGGNVGDTCTVSLPSWVLDAGELNSDIFYTDSEGFRNLECLSLGCDEEPVLFGRTPVQAYADFISNFVDTFSSLLGSKITEITVGMGPAGELRYPSYPEGDARWRFPGVGQFQCYDAYMLAKLKKAADKAGHPEWGLEGPHNAGNYNSRYWETGFFNDFGSWETEYGDFFLTWYSEELIAHADRILKAANDIIDRPGRRRSILKAFRSLDGGSFFSFAPAVQLGIKIAGVHWWYKTASHAPELTAGYYNTRTRNGYVRIFETLAKYGVSASFTCVEMRDCEHPADCLCSPEGLLNQILTTAAAVNVPVSGENALQRYDARALDKIAESALGENVKNGRLEKLTFLRLGDLMIDNWDAFVGLLHRLTKN